MSVVLPDCLYDVAVFRKLIAGPTPTPVLCPDGTSWFFETIHPVEIEYTVTAFPSETQISPYLYFSAELLILIHILLKILT
ncbi:MAG: hypothetical protein ACI9TI_000072 [Natronomonas sp.]